MSTKMYFGYDNDSQLYVIPTLPEEIDISKKGELVSVVIDKFGEVLHKGMRDAVTVKFASFFPAQYSQYYCSCSASEFKKPTQYDDFIEFLMNAEKPFHFVYGSVNMYAIITNYTRTEKGGDPDTLYYSIEFKEFRKPEVKTYEKQVSADSTVQVKSEGSRVNNTESSNNYRVETQGAGLNMRTDAWGGIITCIPDQATVTTDGQTNGSWMHVCYNGTWGWSVCDWLQQA